MGDAGGVTRLDGSVVSQDDLVEIWEDARRVVVDLMAEEQAGS